MSLKIYAISDTHGKLGFKVPSCDLLLHAGDVCPDYAPGTTFGSSMQEQWLASKWLNWLDEQPAKVCYATLGNHDFVYRKVTPPQFKIDQLVEHSYYMPLKCDCLPDPETGGPGCRKLHREKKSLKIWFSPWSNNFGQWAWMASPEQLALEYDNIPVGTDIIVSHQPPYGYGDKVPERYRFANDDPDGHVGSKELLETIERVKPKAVVCGHIHSGFGTYVLDTTTIYNVSLLDDNYQLVREPTLIEL